MATIIPQVITEDRASGAQVVDGSLRFDADKKSHLTKTFFDGDRRKYTWSGWVKRSRTSSGGEVLFTGYRTSSGGTYLCFGGGSVSGTTADSLTFFSSPSGISVASTPVFRDLSAWYHIVLVVDTTQATSSNRVKFYVNGVETAYTTTTYPTQNLQTAINNNSNPHYLGVSQTADSLHFSGQLSDVHFIDGQALDASYFGFTDPLTGTWRPQKFSGSFDSTRTESATLNTSFATSPPTDSTGNTTLTTQNISTQTASTNSFGVTTSTLFSGGSQYSRVLTDASVGSSIPFTIDFIAKFVQSGDSSYFCQLGSGSAIIQTQNPASSTTCLLWGVVEFTMSYGWHSVRVQWDGTRTKLWVDGNLTLNVTNAPGASSGNLAIGAHPTLDVRTFNGEFGPFRLTHGVLGAPRSGGLVASDFTNSTTLDNPNSFYLPFDENSPIGKNKARISVPTPNDGRIWSSLLTPASGSLDQSPTLAFNGTIDGTDPNRLRTSDDYTLVTMDLSSAPVGVSSHVKVYAQTSYDSTCTVTISGTTYTSSSGSRHTFNQPGTLTQMTLRTNSVSGRTYMEGMAIDGIILTDGVDNSSWTPVNFGGSNTIDKSTGALPILNTDGSGKVARIGVRDDVSPETPDVIQGAVSFDGTDDVIQVSDTNLISTTDFTVECFVYTTKRSSGSNQTFVEFNTGTRWIFGMKANTNYMYFWRGSEYISSTPVRPGTWNHVAWVKSGTTLKQYLNGVEVQSQTGLVGSFTSDLISIGRNNDGTEDFQGFISNVRVVESALYTTDFTPPTVQLTEVTGTKLLCCQSQDSAGSAAVSPNISGINDGTVWSDYTNASGGFSQSKANIFDGSTSTNGQTTNANDPINFDFAAVGGISVSSTFSIWTGKSGFKYQINNSGSYTTLSGTADQWTDISFSGTLNNLKLLHVSSDTEVMGLAAIRVDGVVLVDPVSPLYNTHATRSEVSGSLVLALPLVGVTTDLSSLVRGGGSSKTISSVNAVASYAQGNFYGGSYYFDGTGDYLAATPAADFNIATGEDFSFECWAYILTWDGTYNARMILDTRPDSTGGTNYMVFSVNSSGGVTCNLDTVNNLPGTISTGQDFLNKWTHFACSRENSFLRVFVNGQLIGTDRINNAITPSVYTIGRNAYFDTINMHGYMNDVRFYKGVAKYKNNFIPASTDPDVFPDSPSGVSYRSNLALPPSIDGGAVAFDGTDDYLELTSSDVAVGSGDFTIECFVNLTVRSADNHNIFSYRGAGGSATGFNLAVLETSRGLALYSDGSIFSAGIVPAYKWCHIAISRTNGVLKGFIDGLEIASVSNTTNFSNTTLTIGSANGGAQSDAQGFISNFRMIKGTGLYKSNFTPPSSPLTSITNTKLLCCQSNTIAGAASISPNISGVNDGTVWSYYASGFTGAGYTVNKLFDNDTTNTSQVTTSASFTFTPPTPISYSSSIVVKVNTGSGSPMGFNVNGAGFGSYTLYNGAQEVTVVSGSGTLTSLSIAVNAGGGADFYYIKVDGVVLTDPISANGNATATKLNPFTVDIDTVRGNQSGYATLNPLANGGLILADGNLKVTEQTNATRNVKSTIGASSGKFYWELTNNSRDYNNQSGSNTNSRTGIAREDASVTTVLGSLATQYVYEYADDGNGTGLWNNNSKSSYGSYTAQGDVLNIACDFTEGKIWYGKNGIFFNGGNPLTGANASQTFSSGGYNWFPVTVQRGTGGTNATLNFGQKPFKYAPPEGFLPLNAANARPSTVIARPDQYVGVTTYSGTPSGGTTVQSENINFTPDFVWVKARNANENHMLYDSVRGYTKRLSTNNPDQEATTNPASDLSGFIRGGFTVGGQNGHINYTGYNYVTWTWKAGGSGGGYSFWKDDVGYSSASAAGLTGESANITINGCSIGTKQGFSIVKYTPSSTSNFDLPHGLSQAPEFFTIKNLGASQNWDVYFSGVTGTQQAFYLNSNAGRSDTGVDIWNTVDSTKINVRGASFGGTDSRVVYFWHSVPGLQKFGTYTGNANSSNPPFVYLGFVPRLIIMRPISHVEGNRWLIFDSERPSYNAASTPNLFVEDNTPRDSRAPVRILNNGFQPLDTTNDSGSNNRSTDYIYMAWAEEPTFNLYGGQANAQ